MKCNVYRRTSQVVRDAVSGRGFFRNSATGESTWDRPRPPPQPPQWPLAAALTSSGLDADAEDSVAGSAGSEGSAGSARSVGSTGSAGSAVGVGSALAKGSPSSPARDRADSAPAALNTVAPAVTTPVDAEGSAVSAAATMRPGARGMRRRSRSDTNLEVLVEMQKRVEFSLSQLTDVLGERDEAPPTRNGFDDNDGGDADANGLLRSSRRPPDRAPRATPLEPGEVAEREGGGDEDGELDCERRQCDRHQFDDQLSERQSGERRTDRANMRRESSLGEHTHRPRSRW